jgi:DnaD/phage-associated family protein
MTFKGFTAVENQLARIPTSFFNDLLPHIDDLGELKLTIYCLWKLDQKEGTIKFLQRGDLLTDKQFLQGLGNDLQEAIDMLDHAIRRAIIRGTLIEVNLENKNGIIYFLNTPRGRAAIEGLRLGKWQLEDFNEIDFNTVLDRPNVFQLYEANIGPLTPIIADILREVEKKYPSNWIEDAIRIAVENNVRRWRYVEAILHSWQEKGRDDRKNRRDTPEDYQKYTQGEFSEFIKH